MVQTCLILNGPSIRSWFEKQTKSPLFSSQVAWLMARITNLFWYSSHNPNTITGYLNSQHVSYSDFFLFSDVCYSDPHCVLVINLFRLFLYNSPWKWDPSSRTPCPPEFICKWLSIIWKSSGGCGSRPDWSFDQTGMLSTLISNAPVDTSWLSTALLTKKIIMQAYIWKKVVKPV